MKAGEKIKSLSCCGFSTAELSEINCSWLMFFQPPQDVMSSVSDLKPFFLYNFNHLLEKI